MAKKRRHRKGGRVTPKKVDHSPGSRASRSASGSPMGVVPPSDDASATARKPFESPFGPSPFDAEPPYGVDPFDDPDMLGAELYDDDGSDGGDPFEFIRVAHESGEPLAMLETASGFLDSFDPRSREPFTRRDEDDDDLDAGLMVGVFLQFPVPHLSAFVVAVGALTEDDVLRARIRGELKRKAAPVPRWAKRIDDIEIYRTLELTDVLGDSENVVIGTRIAGSTEMTFVALVDHNIGSVMKDAYVMAEPIEFFVSKMTELADDPDLTFRDIPPGDARARLEEAIEHGARIVPRFESETWPMTRPLFEWVLRKLPDDGNDYGSRRPEWGDEEQQALADRFFASPFGRDLDSENSRWLLEQVLWFGSDYGPGDPMRWSPAAVEIILADWIPRKIVADADELTGAPDLLRAFVRFCHHERGIPARLTDETLAGVDEWEPEYQETIRSDRPQGPAALLAAMDVLRGDDDGPSQRARPDDYGEALHLFAVEAVGGEGALESLDDAPLPDEPFDWSGIDDDIHPKVSEVLALCDAACDELYSIEHRTACRRVLARVARHGPDVFRRRGKSETAAAAICDIVQRANPIPRERRPTTKALMGFFGLTGSPTDRARTMRSAAGFPLLRNDALGSPEYLVSARRRVLIARRDRTPY